MDLADLESILDDDPWDETDKKHTSSCKTNSSLTHKVDLKVEQPSKQHLEVLLKCFGHIEFRYLQWRIIHSVMNEKRDNCIIMATGYGKSLCYQFPAVFTNGLTVVISPLISLMEDQVQALEVANIPACFLGTAQTNKSQVMQDLLEGKYRLVYLTPEYASGEIGLDLLPRLHAEVNITLLAIDEAHCVSQWGHDFRPAYRGLGKIRPLIPSVPILAVTATATEDVKADILSSLSLKNPQVLSTGFDRPNLFFKAEKKSGDPYADITKILLREKKIFNIANGSAIVYCLTKKITEDIAEVLNRNFIKCEPYHAGLNIKTRRAVHEQFVKDEIKVIVATVAFGMGIDKPNVRCVIHYGVSSDMESYYQEAGRAGRDGNPSLCIVYHSPGDFVTHGFLREKGKTSRNSKTHKESLNAIMKKYTSSRECRRHMIISYFEKDRQLPPPHSNCCDNCDRKLHSPDDSSKYEGIDSNGMYDFTDDTEKFLMAVDCFHPRAFGVVMLVSLLKGSKSKKMNPKDFSHAAYGAGSSKSDVWWKQMAILLEQEKFIKKETRSFGANSFPVVVLTTKGSTWLNEKSRNDHSPVLLAPTEELVSCLKIKICKPLYQNNSWISTSNQHQTNDENDVSSSTQIENENLQLNEYEELLMKELFDVRHMLAKSINAMPHTVASDFALKQLAIKRPHTQQQLIKGKFDGMSDSKISKFGMSFIKKIKEYCSNNLLPVKTMNELILMHPLKGQSQAISSTQNQSIDLFNKGMNPDDIAISRKLSPNTIVNHICSAIRSGSKIDLIRLTTAAKMACVIKIIQSNPINNDTNKLAPIKSLCPPVISYDDLKLTVAYLEIRNHLNGLNLSYKDDYAIKKNGSNVEYHSTTINPYNDTSNDIKIVDEYKKNGSNVEYHSTTINPYDDTSNDIKIVDEVSKKSGIDLSRFACTRTLTTNDQSSIDSNNIKTKESQHTLEPVKESNLWDIDDILAEDLEQLDELIVTKPVTPDFENRINTENTTEKIVQRTDINIPDTVSLKPTIDKKPALTRKRSAIVFNDSDSDDNDKTLMKNDDKINLPGWMNDAAKAKQVMKKKIAKSSFFN